MSTFSYYCTCPVTISTRCVFPKFHENVFPRGACSQVPCVCIHVNVFPRGACSQVPYFHAVRVPKFHENETDKTGTLPVVNTVPGGGTPRSSALRWTVLGTGPTKRTGRILNALNRPCEQLGTYAARGQSRKTTGPSEKTKKNPGPVEGHGGPWGRPSTTKLYFL